MLYAVALSVIIGQPEPPRTVIISTAEPDLMRRELMLAPWIHTQFRVEYDEPRITSPEWRVGKSGVRHRWPETPDAPKLFHRFRPVVRGCAAWALEYDLWLFLTEDVLREGELPQVAEWPPGARKLRDVPETKCESMGGE